MPASPPPSVLVMSAGSVPGFAVLQALRADGRLTLLAADMNPRSVGFRLAHENFVVPRADAPEFVPRVLEICRSRGAGYVFPIIDEELPVFAEQAAFFKSHGVTVIGNTAETVRITKDKYAFFKRCQELGLLTPRTYLPGAPELEEASFPLLIKPSRGRGSANVYRIENKKELAFFSSYVPDAIIQDFVEGAEYTIDVLTDLKGELICALPKVRIEVKAGMQVKGRTVGDPLLVEYARKVSRLFDLTPRVNIQCIRRGEEIFLIEINPKFPASLPLTVKAGLNLPLLLLQLYQGQPIPDPSRGLVFDLLMLRTWQEFFVADGREPQGNA
ncbi:MAG: ATP-grasp domain-containing protein [Acidobacteria bacterium]|nr:ATP-grasp domain-containing protein [Acidobacteriota bacterium]